jgi:hypothetical protein
MLHPASSALSHGAFCATIPPGAIAPERSDAVSPTVRYTAIALVVVVVIIVLYRLL